MFLRLVLLNIKKSEDLTVHLHNTVVSFFGCIGDYFYDINKVITQPKKCNYTGDLLVLPTVRVSIIQAL